MVSRLTKLFLALLFLQMFLSVQSVLADTGPKPTMDFQFKWESDLLPTSIASGTMYECKQLDCNDAAPLQQLGPQGFRCESQSCNATAYGFSDYHKLEIQFSDGTTRQSNVFQTAGFDSKYTVTVRPDDLLVEAQFGLGVRPPLFIIIITCICFLVGLSLVAVVIIFFVRRPKKS